MKLVLPVFAVVSVLYIAVFGARIVPDLVAAMLGASIYTYVSYYVLVRELPFSKPFTEAQQGSWWMIPLMLGLFVLPAVHIVVSLVSSVGVYAYVAVLLVVNAGLWVRRGGEGNERTVPVTGRSAL
ncbi:hypothetical protein [Paenibacillus sp. YYML68]|uniref:hypothetical protein n=1 Tax=Paenibacillus sp. YYML68 TaxID=2909250 RepID=UPI0024917B90|nr:hypothetical protein [Paenibacillus sp. YYML68]